MENEKLQEVAELHTARLVLRPWRDSDAPDLFKYASDPEVGAMAGWPAHTSVEMSRMVIREVFSFPETYAILLRETGEAIGCCGIVPEIMRPHEHLGPREAEIGYWIGKPYWGRGLVPEAVEALVDRAFSELGKKALWIGCFHHNLQSQRVADKCGFVRMLDTEEEAFFKRVCSKK